MGLTLTDSLALVTKGYKTNDIRELKDIIDKNPDEGNSIIELAKKLPFSDLKSTIALFTKVDSNDPENNEGEDPDKDDESQHENENDNDSYDDQAAGSDDVDYKKLYEEEKNLRTELQRKNQNTDISGKNSDNRSDEDVALQFAMDVLN